MEKFNHKERRFLIRTDSEIDRKLYALDGGRAYEVVTQYLDTPERTWSDLTMGEDHPKIRFRTYDSGESFLEKKIHDSNNTTKERIPCNEIPSGLLMIGKTIYKRTEYEIQGSRITVDRDVCGHSGQHFESLRFVVVEVKGKMPKLLSYLKPYETPRFSKWRFISQTLPEYLNLLIYGVRYKSND